MVPCSRLSFSTFLPVVCVLSHPEPLALSLEINNAHSASGEWMDEDHYEKRCNSIQSQKDRISRRLAAMTVSKREQKWAAKHPDAGENRRDLDHILESHHGLTEDTDEETLIFSDPTSYRMQSEMTAGPYYFDGELVKSNITGGKEGILLSLDIQFIDINTCQPIEGIYIDIWHCNANGVYSGVRSMDNGDFGDEDNIDTSFLRGIQPTDSNGAVQFSTISPGHYTGVYHHRDGGIGWVHLLNCFVSIGRATHVHLLAHHMQSTILYEKDTLADSDRSGHGAQASHVGQLFFDASLIQRVESHYPYISNTQARILNKEDAVILAEAEAETSDAIVQYMLMGEKLEDGIFAWITISIDPEVDHYVQSAATWYGSFGRQWKKLWWR